jgi:hypothetical protein
MFEDTLNRQRRGNRRLMLLLAFALAFAALHVSLHDLTDATGPLGQHECQVCRLNHVPGAFLPAPSFVAPLLVAILLADAPRIQPISQNFLHPWRARAPPLF